MQSLAPSYIRSGKTIKKSILYFSLEGLLSAHQRLAVNLSTRTISLLNNGLPGRREQQLSQDELCLLVPILEAYPEFCPYEILLSYLYSSDATPPSVERWQQHLEQAQTLGTRAQELQPIWHTISSLQFKLAPFRLEIADMPELGCGLSRGVATPQHEKYIPRHNYLTPL